jgi:hypothetical protein
MLLPNRIARKRKIRKKKKNNETEKKKIQTINSHTNKFFCFKKKIRKNLKEKKRGQKMKFLKSERVL